MPNEDTDHFALLALLNSGLRALPGFDEQTMDRNIDARTIAVRFPVFHERSSTHRASSLKSVLNSVVWLKDEVGPRARVLDASSVNLS